MTRDDIYDHLAQVYLGKRNKTEEKKRKEFNAWLVINISITAVIFASAFYGLTAFLTQRDRIEKRIIYSLHQGPLRVEYNFKSEYPPVKTFALDVPEMDAGRYEKLQFTIRGKEEGQPGVVKVVLRNKRNEVSSYYIQGVGLQWREFNIPLEEFKQITDFTNLTDVSFVFEAWNVESPKGVVLIDGVNFSS